MHHLSLNVTSSDSITSDKLQQILKCKTALYQESEQLINLQAEHNPFYLPEYPELNRLLNIFQKAKLEENKDYSIEWRKIKGCICHLSGISYPVIKIHNLLNIQKIINQIYQNL